jgi:hypothetical protein
LPSSYGIHSLPWPSASIPVVIAPIKIDCLSSLISTCFHPLQKCLSSGYQAWKYSVWYCNEDSQDHWFWHQQKIN